MNYNITIKQGNLLSEKDATFMVNASNTVMILGSGVSKAFKNHCGFRLEREMQKKLEDVGHKIEKGDVLMTSSGKATNFLYALHVSVMDYNQGVRGKANFSTLKEIELGLQNLEPYLEWYVQENPNSTIKVVLPLLGGGVGGLNKVEIMKSYKAFFSKEINFDCEVVIYGYGREDFELLEEMF